MDCQLRGGGDPPDREATDSAIRRTEACITSHTSYVILAQSIRKEIDDLMICHVGKDCGGGGILVCQIIALADCDILSTKESDSGAISLHNFQSEKRYEVVLVQRTAEAKVKSTARTGWRKPAMAEKTNSEVLIGRSILKNCSG